MTDEELHRVDAALADRLVDAVQYASTSGEIYSSIGAVLHGHRTTIEPIVR